MDNHLINPENGLYYLNIDVDGNVHTDVTGDEIFPVIFRACRDETAFASSAASMRPTFGRRPGFGPPRASTHFTIRLALCGAHGRGLARTDVVVRVRERSVTIRTLWCERCGRRSNTMRADPKKNNTVPGQFSEWFDGESLTNRGMRLSPWEPPRFLWAAIEGVCGLMLTPGAPQINPLIPGHWTWVGIRRLCYHNGFLSYFAIRQSGDQKTIYSTAPLESKYEVLLFDRDVSDRLRVFSDSAAVVALAGKGRIVILLGNTEQNTVSVPINVEDVVDSSQRYDLRIYNSERRDWEAPVACGGDALRALAVTIEANGFRLLELTTIG